ncbi:hypothetical protein XELAEV_18018395mg [Xenopus laevis]|uniref:Uncharacterized protein n=1 Tax=Xenopus laevis TaxID=8355 RepID=A0A974DDF2_XENLA|nr:hypothetical protein XELAEV_18018395mg [Xenopus laevis]
MAELLAVLCRCTCLCLVTRRNNISALLCNTRTKKCSLLTIETCNSSVSPPRPMNSNVASKQNTMYLPQIDENDKKRQAPTLSKVKRFLRNWMQFKIFFFSYITTLTM